MSVVVYDIETLASCFTYTDINIQTEEVHQFVIHKNKNKYSELIEYLKTLKGQIGFNNLNFDYPIIHYMINLYPKLTIWTETNLHHDKEGNNIVELIYQEAQRIISEQDNKDGFYSIIAIKNCDCYIKQLDLFKVWHYNNKARSTSLKSLMISMNYPNVIEMPIHHNRTDITLQEVNDILEYNLNDVLATYEFYKKSKDKVNLRKSLSKEYNIPCINFSDSKIGEQLILKLYCDKTGTNLWDVKKLRTYHRSIKLSECILSYVRFKSDVFTNLLNKLKSSIITETKGAIEESVIFKGFKYVYGTGGIHGCIKAGIYQSENNYDIIDADVGSLYPNLGIVNNFFIQHLGSSFTEVYKDLVDARMIAKKEGNMVISDALKLAANSAYGKSNDVHSFLYDPKYTMCITLNGQLLLTMLIEKIVLECGDDLQILQVNTDGFTVKINKSNIDKYYSICKQWEKLTKLNLEYVNYTKMVIADVNLLAS